MTQDELADRSGVSVRAIRDLEAGRARAPRWDTVRLLADGLALQGEMREEFEAAARRSRWGVREPRRHGGESSPPRVNRPAQLPLDIADFTGRGEHARQLEALLRHEDHPQTRSAVVICVISGIAGVGKTALAVHVAHAASESCPDGQLYVDLCGTEPAPRDPADVLGYFLRALDLEGPSIPDSLDERSALLRSRLAGRRMLMVLDNARNEEQIRPLLPGTSSCGVLVTSRFRLTGLEGAHQFDLEGFDQRQGVTLLERIAGGERVAREPHAAEDVVRLCGLLPLAIRIAGVKLATRPHWPLSRLAELLADERHRLDGLSVADREVRGSIALTEQMLDAEHRSAFQLLSLLDVTDFGIWTAAALLDLPEAEAEALVEVLVDTQLLTVPGTDHARGVRYRFHDLLRLYGRERADTELSTETRREALVRALGNWLALAEIADAALPLTSDVFIKGSATRFRSHHDRSIDRVRENPVEWFHAEAENLARAVGQASTLGLDELAWEIAASLSSYSTLRSQWDLWRRSCEVALEACRRAGNARGEACMLGALGKLKVDRHEAGHGQAELEWALKTFRKLGDHRGEARILRELASALHLAGMEDEAVTHARVSCRIAEAIGDQSSHADALIILGQVLLVLGEKTEALDAFTHAVAIYQSLGKPRGLAQALFWQVTAHRRADGDPERAVTLLHRCLAILEVVGDLRGQARVLLDLGRLSTTDTEDYEAAHRYLDRCLQICVLLTEDSFRAQALEARGQLHQRRGLPRQALADLRDSAAIWHELGDAARERTATEQAVRIEAIALNGGSGRRGRPDGGR